MKKQFIYVLSILFSVTLFSCGGEKETTEESPADDKGAVKEEVCTYSYDNATTIVQWTAYKFTEKAAVQGKFDTVIVSNTQTSEDPMAVLTASTFEIKTASLQTQDLEKNGNIISAFFGKMISTTSITGMVRSIDGGKAIISLKMNFVEMDVKGEITKVDDKIIFKADINLDTWNGQDAIKSLNEKCKKNHTGKDGKLYVAPDVTIYVETTLKKECK